MNREALDAWLEKSGELVDEMVAQFRDRQRAEEKWAKARAAKKGLDKPTET